MSILRQCPSSPAAVPPLEDHNLLSEILLRLPPEPSSLPRASAVCKRWGGLVSDPGFVRRFRRHHRRNPPPLLGFFYEGADGIAFQPTMDPPNRIPPGRFSMPPDARFRSKLLGCRHGLMLVLQQKLKQLVVWDPVAGDQHRFAVPPVFETSRTPIEGTVLRPVGDAHHFQVVLQGSDKQQQHIRVFACIYSSETGIWTDLISTLLLCEDSKYMTLRSRPALLAWDSVYWIFAGTPRAILELDLGRQSLTLIHLPVEIALCKPWEFMLMPAEGGGLGLFYLLDFTAQLWKRNTDSDGVASWVSEGGGLGLLYFPDFTAQLWKRNTDCDGVASWVLERIIELDKPLSLNSEEERGSQMVMGFAEYNNAMFLQTDSGLFMLQLESLQFKKCSGPSTPFFCYPFESVYAAGI